MKKIKADELPQLFNIFIGDMSFVDQASNVRREIDIYTIEEFELIVLSQD